MVRPIARRGPHCRELVLGANVRNVEGTVLAYPAILWFINTDFSASESFREPK